MGNTPPSPPPLPPPPLPSSSPFTSAEILEERTGTAVLLNIPTKIRKSDVETYIQKHVEDLVPRGNLEEYNPKIFISYATGNRSGKDEDGCGPGMYYTKALVDCFDNLGYDTFTGLHIGPFVNWKKHYIGKLQNNVADVLIVILAPAFFRSLPCLEELYTAKIRGVNILPVSFEHPWVDTDEPWEEAKTPEQLKMKDIVIPAIMETNSHPKPPSTVLQNPAEDLMMIFKKVNEILQRIPYFHKKLSPPPRLLSSSDESEPDDTESSFKPPFKIIAINLRRAPERVKKNRAWVDYLNGEKDELRLNLQKIHKLSSSSKVLIDPFCDYSSGHQRAVVKLDYRVRIKSQLCKDDYDDINYYLGNIRDILFEGLQNVGLKEKEAICILNKMRVYGTWESSINVCFKAPEQAMSVLYNLIVESEVGLKVGMTRDGQPVHAVSLNPLFEVLPQNRKIASALFDLFSALLQNGQDRDCVDLLVSGESENIGFFLPTSSEAASTFFDQGSIKLSAGLTLINLHQGIFGNVRSKSTKEKGQFDDMRGGLSSASSSKFTQNRRSNLDMFINDATAADGDQRIKKLEESVERLLDEKERLENEVDEARDRIENQQQIINERGKCIEKQDDIIRRLRKDLSRIEKAHKEEQAFNQELIVKLQKEKEKLSRKLDVTSVHERLPPDGTTTTPSSLSKLDQNPESKPLASVRPDALGDTSSSETIGGQQKPDQEISFVPTQSEVNEEEDKRRINFMGMSFDTSQRFLISASETFARPSMTSTFQPASRTADVHWCGCGRWRSTMRYITVGNDTRF